MVERSFWLKRLQEALARRSVVWLSGVRRVGKTVLAQSFPNAAYHDCELLRVREDLEDPELFLSQQRGRTLIFDEIHRLRDPTSILKIAADHFPDVRIVATGSSILGASSKFRDTLTGRKANLWLTPMIREDMRDFGNEQWEHRMLHGGLPPFFLADRLPEEHIQEWMDAYFAKDIQELFRLERRSSFLRFTELLLMQSGGMFEATRFTGPCEVSRSTIMNYLAMLEATYLIHVVRPFSSRSATEIVKAPKIYGLDTGFICAMKRWRELHEEDKGVLWEHIVLNELHAHLQMRDIRYWRDKSGHEIDFILHGRNRKSVIAIECKWGREAYDERPIRSFLHRYPATRFFVVRPHAPEPSVRRVGNARITVVDLPTLLRRIAS